ncbi:MAG: cobyrinate a,c-diamide synthase [Scytonema sp. PMC 1069.18]|nr:cobyrinate a,c-diamide synthase [Scytonema sp. PMC 1069.18]MEC4883165.1 cobyrinate a,c-diamide synthase [Scytonema sp. PMC 1070.18]
MIIIIAGICSGVGKTTVTLTLLASLCRRGLQVQSFKVGPDYIDPMFHQHVTGRPCRNLDPVLTSEDYVKRCFSQHAQDSEFTIVEGVMGLFDGIKGNFASTAHVAQLLNLPVVLVIDCSRLSGSVAAIAHGYSTFDPRVKIAGLVLNRVGSDRHIYLLKDALEPLQLPILGILRREDNISIPDRHLGLVPTVELPQLDAVIDKLADLGDSCFDWERLLPLLKSENYNRRCTQIQADERNTYLRSSGTDCGSKIPIAVARDRAFNFYYQDNLDLLQQLGAELVFWSPMEDAGLPEGIKGMYFGGGFPEVFARQLAENVLVREAVRTAVLSGIPTIAECGGLMYLCEQIIDFEGQSWSMAGVLPTTAVMDKRLTLGYRRAVALQDSLLIPSGTTVCGHEFHRSRLISTPSQPLFQTYRYDTEESTGYEGWGGISSLYASYIHLHWGEHPEIPQRFLQNCFIAENLTSSLIK